MQSSFIGVVLAAAIVLSATSVEAQAQLQELSGRLRRQWESGRAEAESLAVRRHFPVRADRAGGSTFELQRLRNGIPQYYTTDNLNAAKTISTDNVWPGGGFGYSLSGSGITLGEWDAGKVRTTHQEFAGRVTSAQGSLHPHSTHVAGTIGASAAPSQAPAAMPQAMPIVWRTRMRATSIDACGSRAAERSGAVALN